MTGLGDGMRSTRQQRGFTLLELMVVMGIGALMMVLTVQKQDYELHKRQSEQVGEQLAQYKDAVKDFIAANFTYYRDNAPNTWDSDHLTVPTARLVADGFLPAGFSSTNIHGSTYRTRVIRIGAWPNYDYEALTVVDPIVVRGNVRDDLAGVVAGVLGGAAGGYATSATQARGLRASWTFNNATFPNITAQGQPVAFVQYSDSDLTNQFLRIDGTNQMQADLNAGNNSLQNVVDLNMTGNIQMNGAWHRIMSQGRLHIQSNANEPLYLNPWAGGGEVVVGGGGGAGNFRAVGVSQTDNRFISWRNRNGITNDATGYRMTVLGAQTEWGWGERGLINVGFDTTGGDMITRLYAWSRTATGIDTNTSGNYLEVGEDNTASTPGSFLTGGDIYLGSRGQWLSQLLPNWVFRASYSASDGTMINKPSCGSGTARIVVVPQTTTIGRYENTRDFYGTHYVYAEDASTQWRVRVLTRDRNALAAGGRALAQTYCYFP